MFLALTIPFGEHIEYVSLQIFKIITVLLPESFQGRCSFDVFTEEHLSCNNDLYQYEHFLYHFRGLN